MTSSSPRRGTVEGIAVSFSRFSFLGMITRAVKVFLGLCIPDKSWLVNIKGVSLFRLRSTWWHKF
jgi:hypothetical protein